MRSKPGVSALACSFAGSSEPFFDCPASGRSSKRQVWQRWKTRVLPLPRGCRCLYPAIG